MESKPKITKLQEFVYQLKVEQVMTKDVISVGPDLPMRELRDILRKGKISGVPVVDGGHVVGLVSIEDFIKWLADGGDDSRVGQCMTTDVVTISQHVPLAEAIGKFEKFSFGRLPVVDDSGKVMTGILTKSDIVKGLLQKLQIDYLDEDIHRYRASHIFQDVGADHALLRFLFRVKGNDFRNAGSCASGLKRTLGRLGIHPATVRRVAIVTYEAEMNVIIYAASAEITAEVEPGEIRIRVQDVGPGIEDIEKAMQPGFSTAPDWVRELGFGAGMGLANIRRCSDKMNLASSPGKGTELNVNISLNSEAGAT